MDRAFVAMTAMPPTTGHLQLIQFASRISNTGQVTVVVTTQPGEPYPEQRYESIRDAVQRCGLRRATVQWLHAETEQDSETSGFREMWAAMYRSFGCGEGDYIVASETYGKWLAEMTGAAFYPYDIERTLNPVKATVVRGAPLACFKDIIPEFQRHLRTRVTIFGSESCGKTTLARDLADRLRCQWLFEYARPYLENTSTKITVAAMEAIWKGQRALQQQGDAFAVIQDTDLFSTAGYWGIPHWRSSLGPCPASLVDDAYRLMSDLYIITPSTIPFEEDPLRYGGDHRETDDRYWIDLCEEWDLPYHVLRATSREGRTDEAARLISTVVMSKFNALSYDRHGH